MQIISILSLAVAVSAATLGPRNSEFTEFTIYDENKSCVNTGKDTIGVSLKDNVCSTVKANVTTTGSFKLDSGEATCVTFRNTEDCSGGPDTRSESFFVNTPGHCNTFDFGFKPLCTVFFTGVTSCDDKTVCGS